MPKKLTDSELQVAILVAQGRTNPEIAALRNTTEKTVKNQLNAIYGKGPHVNRQQLIDAYGPGTQARTAY